MGEITKRNTDARFYTRLEDGTSPKKNFFVYYEIDDQEVMTVLRTPNGTTTARGSCWSLCRVPAPQLA